MSLNKHVTQSLKVKSKQNYHFISNMYFFITNERLKKKNYELCKN